MDKRNILFIGGDERQIFCATQLYNCGYEVSVFGFEEYSSLPKELMVYSNLKIAIILADIIVLPTPFLIDGALNSPYSQNSVTSDYILKFLDNEKIVFGGKFNVNFTRALTEKGVEYYDFLLDESVNIKNAYLTAEGAVKLMMDSSKSALFSKKVLITGFGRISKNLIHLLSAFKTNITVCARKKSDLTWARLLGCKSVIINALNDLSEYDFIINTVPAKIFKNSLIENFTGAYLDLAPVISLNTKNYIKYSGVPGKYAPASSGKIFSDYILLCLKEGKNE